MSLTNVIFKLKADRSDILKTLFETLNSVVVEAPFTITQKKENDFYGLEMAVFDSSSIFVTLKLRGSTFKEYYSKYDNYVIGLRISTLHTALKNANGNEITLQIDSFDKDNLIFSFEDPVLNKKDKTKIKTLVLPEKQRKKQKLDFLVKIVMDSSEFNKICKELSAIGEFLEIKCTKTQLILTCKGDEIESREIVYKMEPGGITIFWEKDAPVNLIQGYYELKNITLFSKCSSLHEHLTLHLNNDFVMCIDYKIGIHGTLLVTIAPVREEVIKNSAYAYSDEEDDIEIKDYEDFKNSEMELKKLSITDSPEEKEKPKKKTTKKTDSEKIKKNNVNKYSPLNDIKK